ncbi:tRNA uridine-5-carboxymethylaminomethyl(34) synthesis GTPase MnmE [Muricoccus radiodurans]|uniref:tRNA uridine-5-carboxymethylaminomethyl(34) synthesis GTPase MnmE n=1 Tax=Muricoccus radiodurans TaxID=2231721 RepID=UPI003CEB09D6
MFALATAPGRSAVAVVRLSGQRTGAVVTAMAGRLPKPRRASLRRLRAENGDVLDEALVLWFPAPGSYTGEDSAELHLHGGPAVVAGVLDAVTCLGARPAEPGEFTRRAVLNSRLDLTMAEGIADLIAAETTAQARQALRQAGGELGVLCDGWSERVTRMLAHQEAEIEFAEEGLPSDLEMGVRAGASALAQEVAAHLADSAAGERVRLGLDVAILGAPNAGKSSLLNALVGREAAIVSARAGTTRDVVEARMILAGLPATLADTAGLREAGDEIEAEGVRRALHRGEGADLVLAVLAVDAEPDPPTLALLARRSCIVIASKTDLGPAPVSLAGQPVIAISARTGAGIADLRARLEAEANALAPLAEAALLTRPRHRAALAEAVSWLREAAEDRMPEIRAEALRAARQALGRLTGRVGAEEVLDQVFAEFCIGK